MNTILSRIEEAQKAFCSARSASYVPAMGDAKSGFALTTNGRIPINGMRHPVAGDTTGWYIWCGEEFSEAPEFFAALHTYHLYEDHPEIAKLLGLPPGYRFLLAGDYVDIWYDESLLVV